MSCIEVKNIAQYEENDSELAKYTISKLEEKNKYLNNKLANYVLLLDQNVKAYDYNYIEILFEKKTRKDILKAYTLKCEQLEKMHELYNKQEIKYMKLKNDLEDVFDKMKEKQVQIKGRGYYYTDLLPIENILDNIKGE